MPKKTFSSTTLTKRSASGDQQRSPALSVCSNQKETLFGQRLRKGGDDVKGYLVPFGYMGFVPWLETYILFATEQDYRDYLTDRSE